ncbi:MAG: hypothetical protein ACRESZ_17155 [Methylococcales bacterium]
MFSFRQDDSAEVAQSAQPKGSCAWLGFRALLNGFRLDKTRIGHDFQAFIDRVRSGQL